MTIARTASLIAAAILVLALPSCKKPNHPPDAPAAPAGPDSAVVGDTLTFSASATDPDDDSVAIRFDWGDGDTSEWREPVPSGDTTALSHVWRVSGVFAIRAQARDVGDSLSDWSTAATVRIDSVVIIIPNEPPDRPYGVCGPDVGRRFIEYEFAASSRDPDGDSVSLRFDWGDGDTSDWSGWVEDRQLVYMKHAWTDGMTFGLRAQARDPEGALSEWTYPMTFAINSQDSLLLWRLDANADYAMCPAIASDGTIYLVGPDGISAASPHGTLQWTYEPEDHVATAAMVGPDGTIYAGTTDGYVVALDGSGRLKWRCKTGDEVRDDLALAADGTIYAPCYDSGLCALSPDHSVRWHHRANRQTPAIAPDGTVLAVTADTLFALHPDGSTRWTYPARTDLPPVIGAAGITFVAEGDHLLAIDSTGSLKWRGRLRQGLVSTPPVIAEDGTVYVGSTYSALSAFACDSLPKWCCQFDDYRMDWSPALTSDGTVYAVVERWDAGVVCAIDANGTSRWRFSPVYSGGLSAVTVGTDGLVYVVDDHGFLSALRGTSPLASSPWPKFHHDLRNTGRVGGR